MENFFNYITKPLPNDEVVTWFDANNIVYEKLELFADFSVSVYELMKNTYLGESNVPNDTKIVLSEEDDQKHFEWCWYKTIENFKKEGIEFKRSGEHLEYFKTFYAELFYKQKEEMLRNGVKQFFEELFDLQKPFTKSDLDMILTIYKYLDKNIKKI